MKKVLFILFLLPVLICNAQENEAITAKLEAKYGRTNVSYQSEGFYVIQKKVIGAHKAYVTIMEKSLFHLFKMLMVLCLKKIV